MIYRHELNATSVAKERPCLADINKHFYVNEFTNCIMKNLCVACDIDIMTHVKGLFVWSVC